MFRSIFRGVSVKHNNIAFKNKKLCTVVIVYMDGTEHEELGIENPMPYIAECRKNPKVRTAYIKPKEQQTTVWDL